MSSQEAVLDASALLAYVKKEAGGEKVASFLRHACISSVNYQEVLYSLISKHTISLAEARAAIAKTNLKIIPYTQEQAVITASFHEQALRIGLSLGDRACLALGMYMQATVVTADTPWKKLRLNIPLVIIR